MAQQTSNSMERVAAAFRRYGHRRSLAAGRQLFMKNDDADEIYYLEQGRVRAYLLYPDGAERTLCYVEHGNLVGEEVVALPPKRIVYADAATDITVTALSAAALIRASREDEAVLRELMALFMQKIELLSNWIFYGQFSRNEARIACFLYDHSEQRTTVAFTQEEIAAVTGMSRVSVSQCLRRFAKNGLIEKGYGQIRIKQRSGLREYFYEQEF